MFSTHDRHHSCPSETRKLVTRGGTSRGTAEAIELAQIPTRITKKSQEHCTTKKANRAAGIYVEVSLDELPVKSVNSGVGLMNHTCSWTGVARGRRPGPVAPCRTPTTGYTLGQELIHMCALS